MKKNILVVDDSALMRRVTSDIINADDRFCVTDVAKNGFEALDIILKNYRKYQAVVLDINMPRMSGLEVLEQLEKSKINKLPIIISSTVAIEGAKETIRALELGAFDFVTKPDSFTGARNSDFGSNLISRLVVATGLEQTLEIDKEQPKDSLSKRTQRNITKEADKSGLVIHNSRKDVVPGSKAVFIACSTGGPKSLHSVIPYIPKGLDAPVILVQHMPEGFTQTLATRLNELSEITVTEAKDGDILEKGHVYIAPGGKHLRINGDSIDNMKCEVYMDDYHNGLRPCADITLESLMNSPYEEITCVVLTGMGNDATQGILNLRKTNNLYIISQDEASCIVYGMPRAIEKTGLVNEVVPLSKIAISISNHVGVQKKWM